MIVVGITGSIASGKTTIANLFAEAGAPVFNADESVRDFYSNHSAELGRHFPGVVSGGKVDRSRLATTLERNSSTIDKLEAIVHPNVRRAATEFLEAANRAGHRIAVLEIPLLFETGMETMCDQVLLATAAPEVLAARVEQRGTMSPTLYQLLVDRLMPDEEKRTRVDYVMDSSDPIEVTARKIRAVIADLGNGRRADIPDA